MALINFISSIASSVRRSKEKKEEPQQRKLKYKPLQIRLTIIETNNYFQEPIIREGIMTQPPTVGETFRLLNFAMNNFVHSTTNVIEVIDNYTFRTKNSKYKIEELK